MAEKEKSLRGSHTSSMAKQGYNGNIPPAVIERLEREIRDIDFGGVSLIIAIRDGHPTFRMEKTVSIMTGNGHV